MNSGRLLPASLAEEARRTAALMVHRLADEGLVSEAVRRSAQAGEHPFRWGDVPLYSGHAGTALVLRYAARAMPEAADQWRPLSRRYLLRAAQHTHERAVEQYALSTGSTGLALAVSEFAMDEPGYQRTMRGLLGGLSQQILATPDWYHEDGASPGHYDVVNGAAGVLGYLADVPGHDPDLRAAAESLIDKLVRMCTPVRNSGHPPWHVPLRFYLRADDFERYPYGHVDLGFAHGLAGVLAALSLAWRAGYRRAGLYEAIRRIVDFLLQLSDMDKWGRTWPPQVPLDASSMRTPPETERMSWCYGPPGICAALLEAADALDDHELRLTAIDGFKAVLRRVRDGEGHLRTASLCHGWSGLLMICQKFAEQAECGTARDALPDLTERVLSYCDPDHLLVVREYVSESSLVDLPGLVDGAGGVPLALWSVATPVSTRWQRALLIR
jgi:lantibiotic biosynthesis protein